MGTSGQPPTRGAGARRGELPRFEREFFEQQQAAAPGTQHERRPPRGPLPPEARTDQLCGLALSGGGIRSATFNLGLLQGLHQLGLLPHFDYVSTVSGGGYIAGFWSAWRHVHAPSPQASDPRAPELFPTDTDGARGADLPPVRHLREFSNFLSPRLGLLSIDTGRMLAAVLVAAVPSLLAALSVLVLGFALWLLAAGLLLGHRTAAPFDLSTLAMVGLTLAALVFWEWVLARREQAIRKARHEDETRFAEHEEWKHLKYYAAPAIFAALAVGALWYGGAEALRGGNGCDVAPRLLATGCFAQGFDGLRLLAPALAWAGATALLVFMRVLYSRFGQGHFGVAIAAGVDRVIGRLLLLTALWVLPLILWLVARALLAGVATEIGRPLAGIASVVVALAGLLARAQQLEGRRSSEPVSPSRRGRLKARLPQLAAYAAVTLMALGVAILLQPTGPSFDRGASWPLQLAGGALAITLLTLLFFDPNEIGLHAFYRGRLARTFLGAAHAHAPGQTEVHLHDDLPLDTLGPATRPLHLICCAANDLSPRDPLANLHRGADSAVLSRLGICVGAHSCPWQEPERPEQTADGVPTLAAALTASGAAFNSHMGGISMRLGPAVAFLMSAFNLRLGLWVRHPGYGGKRLHQRLLVGAPFYRELLSSSRSRARAVLLSDGGHFENMALYELVRRNCRYILASDCGMDSEVGFNDFANAVRRVREDFGVEIQIDLSPLRPGPDGTSTQAMVAGDIVYPNGESGVLLLVKPTLVGKEPADILQYKARNAGFPHESTGDQFYDEAQWESYRRLGEHEALAAFRALESEREDERSPSTAEVFARARQEWLPVPAGFEGRFARHAERVAGLDQLIQGPRVRRLFREVFREVTELDRQARSKRTAHAGDGWLQQVLGAGGRLVTLGSGARASPSIAAPTAPELTEVLHVVRRALFALEEGFHADDLAHTYNHPAHVGIINFYARWASSPLFRMWWPLLKTQCSPRFARFMEERFHLPEMEWCDVGHTDSTTREGFAMECWLQQGGLRPRPYTERLLSYLLELPYGRRPQYAIQAAQLIVRTRDAKGRDLVLRPWSATSRRVFAWQGDDFFVPPGLWGAGIGKDFLSHIVWGDLVDRHDERGTLLAVRLRMDPDAPTARRKRWADDVQLYRSQGFVKPSAALREWLRQLDVEFDDHPALDWRITPRQGWKPIWLVRPDAGPTPGPRCPSSRCAAARAALPRRAPQHAPEVLPRLSS